MTAVTMLVRFEFADAVTDSLDEVARHKFVGKILNGASGHLTLRCEVGDLPGEVRVINWMPSAGGGW